MSDFVVIDGKKYRLIPAEEEKVVGEDILKDYSLSEKPLESKIEPRENPATTVKKAVPEINEYREKFKSQTLGPADFPRPRRMMPSIRQPSVPGDYLLTEGPGLEYDYI